MSEARVCEDEPRQPRFLSRLFRSEALAEQAAPWLGPVLLVPKTSERALAAAAVVATALVLSLLFFATYPRKVRVSGWIVPRGGLVQVFAPEPGVVTEVHVAEGAHAAQGDKLVTLSTERESATIGSTGEHVARQLAARKQSLLDDRRNLERLADQQRRSLGERLAALEASEERIKSEIALQTARVRSATKTVARQHELESQGVGSAEGVQSAEEALIEQSAKLQELERLRLTTERDRLAAQSEIDDLPLKLERDVAGVGRDVAMVEEEQAELAARRELVISAPESGTVTALQAKRGGHPDPKLPLLAIVPKGAALEAELFCSSRAVGFLKVGQQVLMRYGAFPYQKFGHYEGTITNISRSPVSPTELAPELAAVASAAGPNEPVYRVSVTLDSQNVRAFGKDVPLQPGMQLDADVVLERRRLVEWMLEPVFTVTGSLR